MDNLKPGNRIRFTKALLQSLTLPGYYYDIEIRGLAAKLNKDRSFSFFVYRRFRQPGSKISKPERIKIARLEGREISVEWLRRQAAEIITKQTLDQNPAEEARQVKRAPSLGDIFEFYMVHHAKEKRKTWAELEKVFHRSFQDWLDLPAGSITRQQVLERHAVLRKSRGLYSANRAIQIIRAAYNQALREDLVEKNPAAFVTLYPEISRSRVLHEDERTRLIASLRSQPDPKFRDFILLLMSTGQRKSNVLSMRWEDINLSERTWLIPGERMKNGQSKIVALTEKEIEILSCLKNEGHGSFVFPGTGSTGHFVEPKRAWKNLLVAAEIKNLRMHDLRRTNASMLVSVGASMPVIKSALNHKDIKTTMNIYALADRKDEAEAREQAVKRLLF